MVHHSSNPKIIVCAINQFINANGSGHTASLCTAPSTQQAKQLVLTAASLLHGPPIQGPITSVLSFLTHTCGLSAGAARQVLISCGDLVTLSEGNRARKWAFLFQHICGSATQAAIASVSQQAVTDVATRLTSQATAGGTSGAAGVHRSGTVHVQADGAGELGVQSRAVVTSSEGAGEAVARTALLQCPTYFSYSLLNHVGPRFAWARDRGLLHSLLQHTPVSVDCW
jgi:hypothetical protein